MRDDAGPVERVRAEWQGRLSCLRAPGADANLRRAARQGADVDGLVAGAQAEPEAPNGAVVLVKATHYTAQWLGLDLADLKVATGLESSADCAPAPGSTCWERCLMLVRLGGRLERLLGRRGTVRRWLRTRHLVLEPTPIAVLREPEGLERLINFVDRFER